MFRRSDAEGITDARGFRALHTCTECFFYTELRGTLDKRGPSITLLNRWADRILQVPVADVSGSLLVELLGWSDVRARFVRQECKVDLWK